MYITASQRFNFKSLVGNNTPMFDLFGLRIKTTLRLGAMETQCIIGIM